MTTNDQWQTKGLPYKAPFPRKTYFQHVMGCLLRLSAQPERRKQSTFLPKTRDMLVSWSVMGAITWMCQWRGAFWVCQSHKEDKAAELITYARSLYYNQPDWLQQRHRLVMDTVLELRWENGGRILAVPAGEDQIRIHHPHGYCR